MAFDGSLGSLVVQLVADSSGLNKGLEDARKTVQKQTAEITKVTREMGLAFVAAGTAAAVGLGFAVKAAAEAQAAMARVAQFVENAGFSVDQVVPKIQEFSSEMQALTGTSDEVVAVFAARLLPITKDVGRAFEITRSALDLAAGANIDLEAATRLFMGAADGQIGRLGIMVPALRGVTDETLKQMSVQERLTFILEKVQDQYGGLAEKQGATFQGRMKALTATINDLQETIGAALLPRLTAMADGLRRGVQEVDRFLKSQPGLTDFLVNSTILFAGLSIVAGTLVFVFGTLVTSLTALGVAGAGIGTILGGLGAIIAAAVIIAFTNWLLKIEAVRNAVERLGRSISQLPIFKLTGDLFGSNNKGFGPPPPPVGEDRAPGFAEAGSTAEESPFAAIAEPGFSVSGTLDQMKQKLVELQQQARDTGDAVKFSLADAFATAGTATQQFGAGLSVLLNDAKQQYGETFGSAANFVVNASITMSKAIRDNLSSAISGVILGTKSASEAFKEFGQALVKSLVDFVVQYVITQALTKGLATAAAAFSIGLAGALASAWSTAAYFASVATFGGAAVTGSAALATGVAGAKALAAASSAIPALAEGGIVNRPTLALIGEAGPEAVVPLSGKNSVGNVYVTVNYQGTGDSQSDIEKIAEMIGELTQVQMKRITA